MEDSNEVKIQAQHECPLQVDNIEVRSEDPGVDNRGFVNEPDKTDGTGTIKTDENGSGTKAKNSLTKTVNAFLVARKWLKETGINETSCGHSTTTDLLMNLLKQV